MDCRQPFLTWRVKNSESSLCCSPIIYRNNILTVHLGQEDHSSPAEAPPSPLRGSTRLCPTGADAHIGQLISLVTASFFVLVVFISFEIFKYF